MPSTPAGGGPQPPSATSTSGGGSQSTTKPLLPNQSPPLQKSFIDVVRAHQNTQETIPVKSISHHQGEPAVFFSKEEIATMAAPFKMSLVGKFSFGRPTMEVIRKFFINLGLKGTFQISLLDQRHVLINLSLEVDYTRIWVRQSWFINGKSMRVFKWSTSFRCAEESPVVPLWISLPYLPIHFINCKYALYSIAADVGKPLRIDQATASGNRPSVARVLIEYDISQTLLPRMWIGEGKDGFWQDILFERVPPYCSACKHLGHDHNNCYIGRPDLRTELNKKRLVKRKDDQAKAVSSKEIELIRTEPVVDHGQKIDGNSHAITSTPDGDLQPLDLSSIYVGPSSLTEQHNDTLNGIPPRVNEPSNKAPCDTHYDLSAHVATKSNVQASQNASVQAVEDSAIVPKSIDHASNVADTRHVAVYVASTHEASDAAPRSCTGHSIPSPVIPSPLMNSIASREGHNSHYQLHTDLGMSNTQTSPNPSALSTSLVHSPLNNACYVAAQVEDGSTNNLASGSSTNAHTNEAPHVKSGPTCMASTKPPSACHMNDLDAFNVNETCSVSAPPREPLLDACHVSLHDPAESLGHSLQVVEDFNRSARGNQCGQGACGHLQEVENGSPHEDGNVRGPSIAGSNADNLQVLAGTPNTESQPLVSSSLNVAHFSSTPVATQSAKSTLAAELSTHNLREEPHGFTPRITRTFPVNQAHVHGYFGSSPTGHVAERAPLVQSASVNQKNYDGSRALDHNPCVSHEYTIQLASASHALDHAGKCDGNIVGHVLKRSFSTGHVSDRATTHFDGKFLSDSECNRVVKGSRESGLPSAQLAPHNSIPTQKPKPSSQSSLHGPSSIDPLRSRQPNASTFQGGNLVHFNPNPTVVVVDSLPMPAKSVYISEDYITDGTVEESDLPYMPDYTHVGFNTHSVHDDTYYGTIDTQLDDFSKASSRKARHYVLRPRNRRR